MASSLHPARFIGASSDDERPEEDFYPTPSGATWALLQVEQFPGHVWEPACGDGAISSLLVDKGYGVVSTDLFDHGYGQAGEEYDFFKYKDPPLHVRSIMTNPPFEVRQNGREIHVEDWIAHAWVMSQIEKMALFLKTTALAGVERSKVLQDSNFSRLYQFRKRVTLVRGRAHPVNTGMMDFAWYIFERGYTAEPIIRWINELVPVHLLPIFASQE